MKSIRSEINKMIQKIETMTATAKRTLAPVIQAAVIITGVYSAGMGFLLICSLFQLPPVAIADLSFFKLLFDGMFLVSMAGLFLTGGITEALRFVLKSISFYNFFGCLSGQTWGSIGGFFISLAIAGVIFIFPILFAIGVIILFPIIPVLMHRHRDLFSEVALDEADF